MDMPPHLSHPVPPDVLAEIGNIAVSFGLLESTVQSLACSLISQDQRLGQILVVELGFTSLTALVSTLYRHRHSEDPAWEVLKALMNRAIGLQESRNQISHSVWGAGQLPGTVTRIKVTAKQRHGFQVRTQHFSAQDLQETALSLKVLANDIHRFHLQLIDTGKAFN